MKEISSFGNGTLNFVLLTSDNIKDILLPSLEESIWTYSYIKKSTVEKLSVYFEEVMQEFSLNTCIPFIVISAKTFEIVGFYRIKNISDRNKRLEIGGWLLSNHRNKGLNKVILFELFKYSFEVLDVNRAILMTDNLNEYSRRSIEKMGISKEGLLRMYDITEENRVRDMVLYSVVIDEWKNKFSKIYNSY